MYMYVYLYVYYAYVYVCVYIYILYIYCNMCAQQVLNVRHPTCFVAPLFDLSFQHGNKFLPHLHDLPICVCFGLWRLRIVF